MTVYVDGLLDYPVAPHGHREWCHMATDGHSDELHAMASKIGLLGRWFQGEPLPHYDLTPTMRARAIRAGAVSVSRLELARKCWVKDEVVE